MKRKQQLTDYSLGTGRFEGDLKYGRRFGTDASKHGDYPAMRVDGEAKNLPVEQLVLVQPRDPELWKKDEKVKELRANIDNSQHGSNYLINAYSEHYKKLNANIHLKIGRQRL